MVMELMTSPALRPALAAGESGLTATTWGVTGIAEAQTGDVELLVHQECSVQGGVSSGVTVRVWALRSAVGGRTLDLEGHRLARVLAAQGRAAASGRSRPAVDLDDPVPRAEAGLLGGRSGLDAR